MINNVSNNFIQFLGLRHEDILPKLDTAIFDSPLIDTKINLPWAQEVSPSGNIIAKETKVPKEYTFVEPEHYKSETMGNLLQTLLETSTSSNLNNTSRNLSETKKKAMEFFESKGLSSIHSAGIVANLLAESDLIYNNVNKSSGAYGLALWLGDRKKALFKKYGTNPTFELQLEFIWEELNTTEKKAFNHLLSTSDSESAADSFMRMFERPSKKEMDMSIKRRKRHAKELSS